MKEEQMEVVELVVYKIKPDLNENYVNVAIEVFRKLVMGFDGFISYDFYRSSRDENCFMDYVRWSSLEFAEEAARQVKLAQKAPEYKEYLEAFETLEIFNHFGLVKSWS